MAESDDESLPEPKRFKVNVESESSNLAADLWNKKDFTDVVFVVGGREFPAHKMVLASQSQYFRRMLYGEMKEASLKRIELSKDNLTPAAFRKVLEYAYTRSLRIDEPLYVSYAGNTQ
jgi:speckle-type POZ protein